MKIRTKLLITFLSTIILPIIMTLSLFTIYFSYKTRDGKFDVSTINNITVELSLKFSPYLSNMDDYETVDKDIKDELKKYNSFIDFIEVTDLKGNIIYNSNDRNRIGKSIDLNKVISHSNDVFNYEKDTDFYLRIIKPMVADGSVQGFILFKQNSYTLFEYAKTIAYPLLWFGIGSIMLVIVFFSWLISRGIIIPLNELSDATEKISNGNLDFEIKYKKSDEFGTLCIGFETMRDKLKESLSKQVQYENSRKELVASISHDLRTPMTSIKGYVEGLRDGIVKDPEKFRKYLDVIYNKTESMNKLIDDLFEFSRLDLDDIKMNKQVIDAKDMLCKIENNLRYDIEKENINFNVCIDFKSFFVEVDRLRIEEVINNLVFNALRYARTSIGLNACIAGNYLIISVKDDGYGIKDEEKEKIFDRFYKGEKSRSSKYGGAGLGLAIAKKIVEAHSGSIQVESSEGNGTIFSFSIPGIK